MIDDTFKYCKTIGPGLCLSAVIAGLGMLISFVSVFPIMLVCLMIGMAAHYITRSMFVFKDGIEFCAQTLLRIGVALIGLRIIVSDFIALGFHTIAIIVSASLLVLLLGLLLAKALRLDFEQGLLTAGSTAICGVSAALALAALLPRSKTLEQNTLVTIVCVTAIGTILMIVYPLVFSVSDTSYQIAGFMIGGTVHDVSQVVGAGYSVSEETGDYAIMVKLIRVSLLVPLLFIAPFLIKKKDHEAKTHFPVFLLFFAGFVTFGSMSMVPEIISLFGAQISKACLVVAISAVGLKTSLGLLKTVGSRSAILIISEAAFLILFYLGSASLKII